MNFEEFRSKINTIKSASLGGVSDQLKLAPAIRKQFNQQFIDKKNAKKSAVLALFYPNGQNQTHFLLTQRASYNGTHSAQISFPGGKKDELDINLETTAKRETHEEVGIALDDPTIIKQMTNTYIPPSNFLVTPFIGYVDYTPKFLLNHEVEKVIEVKLIDLLDDHNLTSRNMTTSYMANIDVPCFILNDQIVWGATAMILSEIKSMLKSI